MNTTKNYAVATALTAILSLNAIGAAQAADASSERLTKPLGTKRAVGHFQREKGTCKVSALKEARFHSAESKALGFACRAGAESMSVNR